MILPVRQIHLPLEEEGAFFAGPLGKKDYRYEESRLIVMKKTRMYIVALFVMTMLLAGTSVVSAECTAVYVGPEASSDGSVILARCNDSQGTIPSRVNVMPRVENQPGRTMPVDMEGKVQAELPDTTFKYTETPFMDSYYIAEHGQRDSSACINEYGVMMTMSVTAFSNNAAMKADKWAEKGLVEDSANDLVICQSRTARQAVKVLLSLIDKYGSAETNIALIADKKEAWYVAMYTGHQYAAVKLPADKVSVFGNEFTLEYLSDYEESIASEDLEKLAAKNGFAVYGKSERNARELNLYDTYSGDKITWDYSHMRTWIGHKLLSPSAYTKDYDKNERYPLCFEADKKVSPKDVAAVMRNRYDGTKYDPDKNDRIDIRVIGTETSSSTHMMQIHPGLPEFMSGVCWVSTGPLIYGTFVPVSNAVDAISEEYNRNQPVKEKGKFDTGKYPYYAFKALTTLCTGQENAQIYGQPVRDYWKKAERGMFDAMPKVLENAAALDREMAADYLTDYCSSRQKNAFSDAKKLLNDVNWEQSNNSNSMQAGRDPETHEVLKTKRKLEPMKVDLDPAAYKEIPDPAKAGDDKGLISNTGKIVILIMAAIGILCVIMKLLSARSKKQ